MGVSKGFRPDVLIANDPLAPTGRYGPNDSTPYLEFDSATVQGVYIAFVLPPEYAGNPVFDIHWSGITVTSALSHVRWACTVQRLRAGVDGNPLTENYGPENYIDASISASAGGDIQVDTLTLTNFQAGAANDMMRFQFYRQTGGDNLAESARLWYLLFRGDAT